MNDDILGTKKTVKFQCTAKPPVYKDFKETNPSVFITEVSVFIEEGILWVKFGILVTEWIVRN